MLEEIKRRVGEGKSFAFETTLSRLSYAKLIPRWRSLGYHVKLIFLILPNADLAVARVASRAAQGGHDVPETIVRRRFDSGLRNFHSLYRALVNSWVLYDNSGSAPRLHNRETTNDSKSSWFKGPRHPGFGQSAAAAARRALELGLQTGTPVYILRRGRIIDLTKEKRPAAKTKKTAR